MQVKIYIDRDYKCYTSPADDRKAVETDAFDGKCKQYIEGCRFIPAGETWVREDGEVFTGEIVAPWRDFSILDEFQAIYEEEQARQADMAAALEILGVSE